MFGFLHSRRKRCCTNWAIDCWLLLVLCFSFVSLSYQSNNAINSPSTVVIEGTLSDADMGSAEPTMEDTTYDGHKLPCTKEEDEKVGCLNGKCFAVDLQPRVAGCACLSGWEGKRCEFKEIPPEFWEASSLIGLIVGLVACVAVVVIGLLIFFIKKRPYRSHTTEENNDQRNTTREGEENLPLKTEVNGNRNEQPSIV